MSLKCHICGKEYYHDGKICHTCEETANNSSLSHSGVATKKWRCDNFLELDGLPFGCNLDLGVELRPKMIECPECGDRYSYGRRISHTCTSNSITFGKIFELETQGHKWNCDNAMACLDLLKSNLDTVGSIAEDMDHNEKLENYENNWNILTTIRFDKTEMNEKKINHFLRFE
ncbi:MAG: hypothetical protein ACXAC5_21185 [Promethearchaeota archaeon]|jgi:hypothetical protein